MPAGGVDEVGVEQVGEQLGAVDEARAGARVGGGGVDGEDAIGAEGVDPGACSSAWAREPSTYMPQGMTTTRSGLERGELLPLDLGRLGAGRSGDVLAAGELDHLRDPVAADEGRVEPLQGDDPRPRGARDRGARPRPAVPPASPRSWRARSGIPAASPSRVTSSSTSPRLLGSCCTHPRRPRQPRRHLDHVLVGDGADVADRLGDDQVRRQRGQPRLVEAVERPAFADDPPSRRRRSRRRRGPPGRTVAVRCGSSLAGRREVALVGDADHALAEPERKQHLGRRGNEARDPHPPNMPDAARRVVVAIGTTIHRAARTRPISPPPPGLPRRLPCRVCWDGSGPRGCRARAVRPSGSRCSCRRRGRRWRRTS